MEERTFIVQGSAANPYEVRFKKEGDNLSAYCTCPAGKNGQYCKHRFNILGGDITKVVSGNIDEVVTVANWLPGSDVEAAMSEVKKAEDVLASAKKDLSRAKKQLAAAMRD